MEISFDTNRLTHPAQRRFNAAWHEMEGSRIQLLPWVARELTGYLILPENLGAGRQQVAEALLQVGNRGVWRFQRERLSALWWADELLSDDGLYRLLSLSPEQEELVGEVCRAIDPEAFPRLLPEDVPENSDTRIIAQALVTGRRMLITSNMRSVLHHDVNDWAERNAERFGFTSPHIMHVQDEVMPSLYPGLEGRRRLVEFAIGSVWPGGADGAVYTDADADAPEIEVVEQALYGLTRRAMPGARLGETAIVIEESWERERDPEALIERVRANLPLRMMASERRHPAWPGDRHVRPPENDGGMSGGPG